MLRELAEKSWHTESFVSVVSVVLYFFFQRSIEGGRGEGEREKTAERIENGARR